MKKIISLLLISSMLYTIFAQTAIDIFDMNNSKIEKKQTLDDEFINNGYIVGDNDEIQIRINIWGEVKRTGQFTIPSDTDLVSMISFCGGPSENANLSSIKIVRTNLELGEEAIIYVNLEDFLQTGDYDLLPPLKPGDTIIVPGNIMSYFSNFINVVAKLALIVNIYYTVSRINE
ncbi:MAG: SLBB domain-containing protein [Candidatus Delongbacteria bacterium]|nr:SLBB domain-containing protein [Candidatus Delongbacteria bacterium]MBN2834220.1 SLBB domain-containing protein [Candidatus Delongbacteria bacterium]